jgi:hypothetical protein
MVTGGVAKLVAPLLLLTAPAAVVTEEGAE